MTPLLNPAGNAMIRKEEGRIVMGIVADKPRTVADLVKQLGCIPTNRIRLIPPPGKATVKDVLKIHDRENRLCELVDGVVVEKPMAFYESLLAILIGRFLIEYLDNNDLGVVAGADGMLRLAFDLVRIPDVSFVSWTLLPGREIPAERVPRLAPDLAIEVISAGNTPREMARKLREYFKAGVRLVWFIYPETRTAEVYTAVDQVAVADKDGILDGGEVLPGFSLSLKKLFERAGRQAPSKAKEKRKKNGSRKRQDNSKS